MTTVDQINDTLSNDSADNTPPQANSFEGTIFGSPQDYYDRIKAYFVQVGFGTGEQLDSFWDTPTKRT